VLRWMKVWPAPSRLLLWTLTWGLLIGSCSKFSPPLRLSWVSKYEKMRP
jgi:hypothetical protein